MDQFGTLFASVMGMAGWAAIFTGFVRKHFLPNLDGLMVTLFAIIVAFATTAVGVYVVHMVAWQLIGILAFSILAGVAASGSIVVGKSFLSGPIEKAVWAVAKPLLDKILPAGVKDDSTTTTSTADPTPPSPTS